MTTNPWLRAERPLVIAHRGHSIAVPENTIEAYRRAIELGVEMIECDVNITRDGELVMIHDWTLDRTTNGSGPVRALALDEVRSLDAGSRFGPEFAGLRVPTAAETIELAREAGILMCFEVKGATPEESHEIGESLADLLARSDALDWAFMSGYDHAALAAARARVPELLLAPERLPDDVPPDRIDALRQASGLGAPVLQNHWQFLTPDLIATLHDARVAIWAWPTTDPDSIELSIAAGVDGLMGDDVEAIVHAVAGLEVGRP